MAITEILGIILIWIVRTITTPHFYLNGARVIANRPFHMEYANMGSFGHICLSASPLAAFVIYRFVLSRLSALNVLVPRKDAKLGKSSESPTRSESDKREVWPQDHAGLLTLLLEKSFATSPKKQVVGVGCGKHWYRRWS